MLNAHFNELFVPKYVSILDSPSLFTIVQSHHFVDNSNFFSQLQRKKRMIPASKTLNLYFHFVFDLLVLWLFDFIESKCPQLQRCGY